MLATAYHSITSDCSVKIANEFREHTESRRFVVLLLHVGTEREIKWRRNARATPTHLTDFTGATGFEGHTHWKGGGGGARVILRRPHDFITALALCSTFNSVCKVKEVSGQSGAHPWVTAKQAGLRSPQNKDHYCSLLVWMVKQKTGSCGQVGEMAFSRRGLWWINHFF